MMSLDQPNILNVSGDFDATRELTVLRLLDGRVLRLNTNLLAFEQAPPTTTLGVADGPTLIPIVEEHLEVGKRVLETAKIRVYKTVQEYEEALNEPLAVRTYDEERIILNRPVEVAPPPFRHEGDTIIFSLVEEQLVLTKQLVLREEVRMTRRDTERIDTQVVTLKRENLVVEREAVSGT